MISGITPKSMSKIKENIKDAVFEKVDKEIKLAQQVIQEISDLYYYDFLNCPRDKEIAKLQKFERKQKIELANDRFGSPNSAYRGF